MKEAVTKVIDTLTQEDIHEAFQKLLERYAEYSDQVVLVVEIELREVSAFTQAIINKSGAKAIVTPLDGQ